MFVCLFVCLIDLLIVLPYDVMMMTTTTTRTRRPPTQDLPIPPSHRPTGTLHLLIGHLASTRVDTSLRFYGPGSLLLHADAKALLVDLLRSLAEHYRLDLSGDVACPTLDEEPEWPLLELDTAGGHRQRQGREQGAAAARLMMCYGRIAFGPLSLAHTPQTKRQTAASWPPRCWTT